MKVRNSRRKFIPFKKNKTTKLVLLETQRKTTRQYQMV